MSGARVGRNDGRSGTTAAAATSYVLVQDVPATWAGYRPIVDSLAVPPDGLVLHAAGPTDEGFRIVEVWASEADWRRFAGRLGTAIGSVDPDVEIRPVVRSLLARHVVLGPIARASPDPGVTDSPEHAETDPGP